MSEELPPGYLEAMLRHGHCVVEVRLTVAQACSVIALLQLALRHPSAQSGPAADQARRFAQGSIDHLAKLDPVFAHALEMGWDPELDVPADG